MELTQEQKRIKIAKACGMTGWQEARSLPDYFNDLNAIHEAKKKVPEGLRLRYRRELNLAANGLSVGGLSKLSKEQQDQAFWQYTNASAADHAEAFGKTLNLW
jgi:hypothetical protein